MKKADNTCKSCKMGTHVRCREVMAIRADLLAGREIRESDRCGCRCRRKKRRPQHDTSASPAPQHRTTQF
jgi:hypothetical protein